MDDGQSERWQDRVALLERRCTVMGWGGAMILFGSLAAFLWNGSRGRGLRTKISDAEGRTRTNPGTRLVLRDVEGNLRGGSGAD
jgi:hypothetical protein